MSHSIRSNMTLSSEKHLQAYILRIRNPDIYVFIERSIKSSILAPLFFVKAPILAFSKLLFFVASHANVSTHQQAYAPGNGTETHHAN